MLVFVVRTQTPGNAAFYDTFTWRIGEMLPHTRLNQDKLSRGETTVTSVYAEGEEYTLIIEQIYNLPHSKNTSTGSGIWRGDLAMFIVENLRFCWRKGKKNDD